MIEQPLLPVGRDCDCGQPLVWSDGHQWCAVYGSHNNVAPHELDLLRTFGRNPFAPGAALVDELAPMKQRRPKLRVVA